MFVTFHLTLNAPMAVIGKAPQPYGDLARYLTANPDAKLIPVQTRQDAASTCRRDVLVASSKLIGDLARRAVSEDACVIFPPRTPKRVLDAAARKFAYIVLKDRNPPPDFSAPIFQTGQFRFKVEYKTSDNVPHAVECRADSRGEMYQKAKSVRVRPSRVTQLDIER